ncbi:MAG: DNA mismatch repair protein MutS [Desulfofustis sp.]|nr:DNA mismatch repair protein MutS [Desulfofustis sp.]
MTAPPKMTPMLRQYLEIKEDYPNEILFYRMGDFYEMFFEDAEVASKILGITLTSRNNKADTARIPMCGVPYHAAQNYLAKLVKAGERVAICEQTEDPSQAKGIVRREVIRVVTPGVTTDDQILEDNENCYVCALSRSSGESTPQWGFSFLDLSTGEFLAGEESDGALVPEQIIDHLTRMRPAELLVNEGQQDELAKLIEAATLHLPQLCITPRSADLFHVKEANHDLVDHFKVINLDGFGCGSMRQGIVAAGALLDYARETQKSDIGHIEKLIPLNRDSVLLIDDASRRNLELTRTIIGNNREGSLLSVLDKTRTPMGGRLLQNYLLQPLQDIDTITERQDCVSFFHHNPAIRQQFRDYLQAIYDLERLNSRMVLGQGNGRDAVALRQSLAILPGIHTLLKQCATIGLQRIDNDFDDLAELADLLDRSIGDEPPVTLRDGNLIREGYNEELDQLIHLLRDGKALILGLENQEREKTGITKLKIGYNKVFGYYIEVGNAHLDKVPEHYLRKQTLVNAERFITPELKEFESRVLTAQERRLELEYQLFIEIRTTLAENSSRILQTAKFLARIDVFTNLAEIARHYHYTRPELTNDGTIQILEGRHPVIERSLATGKFVPNDISLDQSLNQVLVITGPNMAGKSTILRQTALIVLLAQMGSFVPAEKSVLSVVDRIFTRVGAMDDLRRGQSTFMVEMNETANILNNATPKSLVILDEIGRGTSTYDGLSIAWAVAEALVNKDRQGVKTLFATHYHELTELAKTHDRVQNYSVAVKEWNETIIFLYKLIKGGTSRSYGIQVAALAGVPDEVVARAQEILKRIDQADFDHRTVTSRNSGGGGKKKHPSQLQLFSAPGHPVVDQLGKIDLDNMTPRQALEHLYSLKGLLDKK